MDLSFASVTALMFHRGQAMVAIIGYPGSTNHRWERFPDKAQAQTWLRATGQEMYDNSGGTYPDALSSQRVISEKEAASIKYRDGTKCYPKDALG